jgi:exoribonuclease R
MKNWVIQGLLYDFHPSPLNYIKSKWYHFHFCKKDDPTITAALYLDNLANELKHELVKQISVIKKSLTLAVIKKILENKESKQKAIVLFERKEADLNKEIKMFLENIASLIHPYLEEKKQINGEIETVISEQFPARTYISPHICF